MGETIRVSDEGLHELAQQCDAAAGVLASGRPAPAAGPPFQASATAISHAHTLVAAAAQTLAARATDTGTKLRAAASSYTSTDGESAEQIGSVGRSIEV